MGKSESTAKSYRKKLRPFHVAMGGPEYRVLVGITVGSMAISSTAAFQEAIWQQYQTSRRTHLFLHCFVHSFGQQIFFEYLPCATCCGNEMVSHTDGSSCQEAHLWLETDINHRITVMVIRIRIMLTSLL